MAELVTEADGWTAQTISTRAAASVTSPQARTCKYEMFDYQKISRGEPYS
jgi:hypothetical protein